jgi:hypothetical protein
MNARDDVPVRQDVGLERRELGGAVAPAVGAASRASERKMSRWRTSALARLA